MLWMRTPEKVYFKKGCMPVALDELGTVMGKKRCFIVTDSFLYKNGYTKPIEDKLDQMGMVVDLKDYLTEDEKAAFVPGYITEGDFDGSGSIKIFPVAKSTELMFFNDTDGSGSQRKPLCATVPFPPWRA